MAYVIRVSKSTYNVLTETDPNNLIFDSDKNNFKILAEAIDSETVGANGTGILQVSHSLGIVPAAFCIVKYADTGHAYWAGSCDDVTNANFVYHRGMYRTIKALQTDSDSAQVMIDNSYGSSSFTVYGKFYLVEVPLT